MYSHYSQHYQLLTSIEFANIMMPHINNTNIENIGSMNYIDLY